MSEILVNEIKHRNGTSAVAINTSAQMTVRGEGGNATTNLQQGLSKAWCYVEGDAQSPLINSFGGSSLTDSGTGDYTYNLTNNFNYTRYCVTSNESREPSIPGVGGRSIQCDGVITSSWGINTYAHNWNGSTMVLARLDDSVICSAAHGDLA